MRTQGMPRTALGTLVLLAIATHAHASTSVATGGAADSAPPPSFEGIWLPEEVLPPQAPQDDPGTKAPPVELTGTVLQCAPVQHLLVGGGGMSMLLIQNSAQIVLISEFDMDIGRKIYLNVKHPRHLTPQPNGHSIGHWEGNTLVVDTIGYLGKDGKNNGQHVVERFSREGDTLVDQMTITDESGQAQQQTFRYQSRAEVQFNENVCEEGFDRYQVVNGALDNPNTSPKKTQSLK